MALSPAQLRMLRPLADGPLEGAVLFNDYGPRRGCPDPFMTADKTLDVLLRKGMVERVSDGVLAAEYEITDRGRRYVERH